MGPLHALRKLGAKYILSVRSWFVGNQKSRIEPAKEKLAPVTLIGASRVPQLYGAHKI